MQKKDSILRLSSLKRDGVDRFVNRGHIAYIGNDVGCDRRIIEQFNVVIVRKSNSDLQITYQWSWHCFSASVKSDTELTNYSILR